MYGLVNTGLRDLMGLQKPVKKHRRFRTTSRRFRQRIFWRDGGRCVYCDQFIRFSEMTLDHITPLVRNGPLRQKENCAVCCRSCNSLKGQLELQDLGDLAPEVLMMKFINMYNETATRKGRLAAVLT